MRKVILISLSVLVLVGGAAYCISWYAQASQTQKAIEEAIAKVNAKQTYITYESIETSGFPSNVYVAIVKPRFSGRVDTLLKELEASAPPPPADPNNPAPQAPHQEFAHLPEWSEDFALDGHIMFGINAMSSLYTMNINGNWSGKSSIAGQPINWASQGTGDMFCSLELDRGGIFGSLWDFSSIADGGDEAFFHDFRVFDCLTPGYTITDATTQEKMMLSNPGRFYITSTPDGASHQLRVYLKSADVEITAAGDKWMHAYFKALAPQQPFPPSFAIYGKQNIEMDFSYVGPSDLQNANLKDAPFSIDLGKFEITNQVYNSTATFSMSNGMNGPSRAAKFAFNANSTFSEHYDTLIRDMARNLIHEIYTSNDPQFAQSKPFTQQYTQEQMYAIVYPSIPNFHSLGKLTQAVDLNYLGAPDMTSGDVNLTTLELSANSYGITGSGTAKIVPGQMFPTANMAFVCRNCYGLVDDVIGYMARLQKTISYFNPEQAASFTITPELIEGIKDFMKVIAEPTKDTTSFTYTLVSDPNSGISISGHPIAEVMTLHKEYIGSIMRKQASN